MGGWAVAQSPILMTTITLKRLRIRGYQSLLEHYTLVTPLLNEPPYTRTVPYGDVRGAPWAYGSRPSTRLALLIVNYFKMTFSIYCTLPHNI